MECVPRGSQCSPCLRGEVVFGTFYHHGGTENTETALRQSQIRDNPMQLTSSLLSHHAGTFSNRDNTIDRDVSEQFRETTGPAYLYQVGLLTLAHSEMQS